MRFSSRSFSVFDCFWSECENENHSVLSNSLQPCGLYSTRNSPGQNTRVGSLFLLQGIFPTQGSNPGLSYCRWILYQLTHKGSSRILEWVAYPFSRGSSWPRNWTRVSCIAGGFFTNWAIREAIYFQSMFQLVLFSPLLDNGPIISPPENCYHSGHQLCYSQGQSEWYC